MQCDCISNGSVYFAAKMPTATAWLELLYRQFGRNELKRKDKP